jgi:hypothetical protein
MIKFLLHTTLLAVCASTMSIGAFAQQTPAQEAAREVERAMAKARAEKARNDAIVEQQRAAERARKAQQSQEQQKKSK